MLHTHGNIHVSFAALCDTLSSVSDGTMGYSSNGTVTVVTYSCHAGYSMHSVTEGTTAVCGDEGTWDSITISCGTETCSHNNEVFLLYTFVIRLIISIVLR